MSNELITALQSAAGNVSGDFYPYTVDNSARFDSSGPNYLEKTLGTATDRKKFTFSFWVKPCEFTNWQSVLGTGGFLAGAYIALTSTSTGTTGIRYLEQISSANAIKTDFIGSLRDPSSFYHIVVVRDTTEATDTDRVRLYVNGTRFTQINGTPVWPSLNRSDFYINGPVQHSVGETLGSSHGINPLSAYLSEVVFIDGQGLEPTDFAEDKNGVWVPKDVSGLTFGNNGFYLDFADSSNLGNDVSGNNNDFTSSGLTSSDQMPDTPTNNFTTFSPLHVWTETGIAGSATLSDGNLSAVAPAVARYNAACSIAMPTTGKWYCELTVVGTPNSASAVGIEIASDLQATRYGGLGPDSVGLRIDSGTKWINSAGSAYGNGAANGDIIQIAVDRDAGKCWFGENNTWYNSGDPEAGTGAASSALSTTEPMFFMATSYDGGCDYNANFGQLGFTYTPPTDFLALSTANLPEPTIGPNSDIKPSDVFATVLYTGNGTAKGSGGNTINLGVDMTSGKYMVAIKNRDAADSWMVFDTMRGDNKYIEFDSTDAEVTDTETCEFTSTGVKLGNNTAVNTNGEDYVLYWFKATPGFFDIQLRVGTGSAVAHDHDLGVKPNFMTSKLRTTYTSNIETYVDGGQVTDPATDYYQLSSNSAVSDNATVWNDTEPTSTQYTVGTGGINVSGEDYVQYLWADVEGFCKTGYHKGNGSSDGPLIFTGFRPAFVIVKQSNVARGWYIFDSARDTYNAVDDYLRADTAAAEANLDSYDFLSNGFKLRNNNASFNESGGTYIYMAFAENPFKYANAR